MHNNTLLITAKLVVMADWTGMSSKISMTECVQNSVLKIGKKSSDKQRLINNKIPFDWLNASFESYKLKCKFS